MSDKKTQEEFDNLKARTIHLLIDDGQRTLCSGEKVDTWGGERDGLYKYCEACRLAAQRKLRGY